MTGRDGFDDLDAFFARPRTATRGTAGGRGATGLADRPAVRARSLRTRRPPRPRSPRSSARTSSSAVAHSVPGAARTPIRTSTLRHGRTIRRDPAPAGRGTKRPLVDTDRLARRTRVRLVGFVVVVVLAGAGITTRLVDVQLGGAGCRSQALSVADCRAYGAGMRDAFRPLPAGRGAIFDRHGQAFALSVPQPNVVADPASVPSPTRAARALAPVLGVDENVLVAKLAKTSTRYQLLANTVAPEVRQAVRDLKLEGITLEAQYVRQNPSEGLAGAVVGRTYEQGRVDDQQRQGQTGLELAYDDELAGAAGRLSFEKDPKGRTIAGTSEKIEAAKPGTDLYLTLDQSLQYATEQAVADQVRATGAEQAMAVISRPSTGEILAMASVADDGRGDVAGTVDNRPVTNVFEPGSVNKMITIAGAMEEGLVDPDTTFAVPDNLRVADHRFTDHDAHPTSPWSTTDILVTSSNVGTIMIAQELGQDGVDEYLRKFGFGQATSTDFPGEVNGLMLAPDDWSGTSIGAIPIGQGISVTALQMLAAYNVIANDGVYVAPKLVAATDTGDGRVATTPSDPRRVVSPDVAEAMGAMLVKVVSDGTGQAAQVPGYPAAGKTGTARIPQPAPHADPGDAYQDAEGDYHYQSSFVGFVAGADLSVIVTVQDAQTSIYGSEVAAPVFAHLASLALRNEQTPPPALAEAAADKVPEVSDSAKEIDGEGPGLAAGITSG